MPVVVHLDELLHERRMTLTELADQVGLDICLHVSEVLKAELKWPMPDAPQWLRDKVAAGELGAKSGRGIYVWQNGDAVKAFYIVQGQDGSWETKVRGCSADDESRC